MKKNKNIFIFVGLIILVVVLLIVLFLSNRGYDGNDPLIKEIYTYIGSNNLDYCNGLSAYSDKKVNYESISNDMRICNAYILVDKEKLETITLDKTKKNNTCSMNNSIKFALDGYEGNICTITKTDASLVNEVYKKMYGYEIKEYDSFKLNNNTICYYESDNFYCGLSESYVVTVGAIPKTHRVVKKVKNKKDEIIIYDYFLKTVNDECFNSYESDKKNVKCSNKYSDNNIRKYNFVKKYGTLYEHVFKLKDENYYWVSTKPVK